MYSDCRESTEGSPKDHRKVAGDDIENKHFMFFYKYFIHSVDFQ